MAPKHNFDIESVFNQLSHCGHKIAVTGHECNCIVIFVANRVRILCHCSYNARINFLFPILNVTVLHYYFKSRPSGRLPQRVIRRRTTSKEHTSLYVCFVIARDVKMKTPKVQFVSVI